MLAGLDDPTAGEIAFMGKVVSLWQRRHGGRPAATQCGAGVPVLCVVAAYDGGGQHRLAAEGGGLGQGQARRADCRGAGALGITALRDRYPAEISGGQQQRVAIARTIMPKPAILLFDEPLSNLDAKLRIEMRAELMRIHRATGATSVYVTHDQVEAMTMATHVAVMNQGRVERLLAEGSAGAACDHLRRHLPWHPAGQSVAGETAGRPAGVRRGGPWPRNAGQRRG